jgi:hypothetical protein
VSRLQKIVKAHLNLKGFIALFLCLILLGLPVYFISTDVGMFETLEYSLGGNFITGAAVGVGGVGIGENSTIIDNSTVNEIILNESIEEEVLPIIVEPIIEEVVPAGLGITVDDSEQVNILVAPSIGNMVLNATTVGNNTNDNLTVYFNATGGDPVKNITNWYVNGTSLTLLNTPFEKINNTGGNNTLDYSGFANSAIENNVIWKTTGGYDGKGAYEFDGLTSHIDYTVNVQNVVGMTFMCWVNLAQSPIPAFSKQIIFSHISVPGGPPDSLVLNLKNGGGGNELSFSPNSSNGLSVVKDVSSWSQGDWHHAAGSFNLDSGYMALYVDGNLAENTTDALTFGTNTANMTVGAGDGHDSVFNGTIDDCMIFNRSLSPEQINAIYNNRTDLIVSNETTVGDNWSACVTPNDGSEDGARVCSSNVTILAADNILPTVDTMVLNTTDISTNLTNTNLTLYFNSTDADADLVKNITNWYKNGTSITLLNMPFEKVNGTTTNNSVDYSGYGKNGDVSGATWNATGGFGGKGAYEFDGTDDYITTNSIPLANQDFTLEAWARRTTIGSYDLILWEGTDTDSNGLQFGFRDNNMFMFAFWGNDLDTISYTDTNWHHWVGTYNAGSRNRTIYRDSVIVGNDIASSNFIGSSNLFIGDSPFIASSEFNGTIDDVKIYNHTLSAQQVSALFNNQTDLIVSNETQVNDVWQACVTPNDGSEDGAQVCSSNVTILAAGDSTAPVVSLLHPVNDTRYNLTTIDLNFTATDETAMDSCWYTIDAGVTNTTLASCANTTFTPGRGAFNITVYANDTSNNLESVNSNFSINQLPIVSNVIVNTTDVSTNDTNQNVTLYFDASDVNSDPIKNITNWYKDGNSITVLNMPFEKINGTSTNNAWDYSGYGNNGSVSGATWNATGGYDGKGSYKFDLGTDLINITYNESLKVNNLTVMAWIKPVTLSGITWIVGYPQACNSHDPNYMEYGMWTDEAALHTRIDGDGKGSFGTISTGVWNHVAISSNGTNTTFYVNGAQVGSGSGDGSINYENNCRVIIGQNAEGSEKFNGVIDEVMIFNKSLSAQQISAFYNNRTDLIVSQEITVGDNWNACVTPNDGEEDGATVCSNNVTILSAGVDSTAPIVTIANPVNDTRYNLTTVDLNFTASDETALDDCWYTIDTGATNTTIASCANTTFTPGRGAFNITLYANDTTNNLGFANGNFSINQLPSVDTLVLNTSDITINGTNQNLTFYFNATDLDGDSIKNITNWYLNGTSITIMNIPFEKVNATSTNNAFDYSGNGNNGTINGATWNESGGYDGKGAYKFDGSSNYITTPLDINSNLNQGFTLAAWAKHDHEVGVWSWIFGSQSGGYFQLGKKTGEGNLRLDTNDLSPSSLDTVGVNIADGSWHHVAATWNTTQVSIYYDGSLNVTAGATGVFQDFDYLWLGAHPGPDEYWNGTIDEVLVYNFSLSAEQISALYDNRTDLIVSNETQVNDVWQACVTPNDGEEDGSRVCSNNVTILAPASSSCGTITQNTTLTQNVTSAGTCFTIGADNVIIDCAGYAVNYGTNGTANMRGVSNNGYDNLTVRNCNLIQANSSGSDKDGIYAIGALNNVFINNTISTSGSIADGIWLGTFSNNSVIENNTITSAYVSVFIDSGDNLRVAGNTINATSQFSYYALGLGTTNSYVGNNEIIGAYTIAFESSAANNTLHNNNLSGTGNSILINDLSDNISTNYLVYNNSFGEIRWNNESNGSLLRTMDLVNMNITSPGVVNINNNSIVVDTTSFGTNPTMNSSVKLQFFNVGTFTYPTALENGVPCGTRCTTPTSITNGYTFNATFVGNFSLASIPDCGTITQNTTLTQNITSAGTCFTIGAHNIEVDCAGYTVNYGTNGSAGMRGVLNSGYDNVTIRNCNLIQANSSGSDMDGISATGALNCVFINNTITTTGSLAEGIYLGSASNNCQIENNTITTSLRLAMTIDGGDNLSIIGNSLNALSTGAFSLDTTNSYISNNVVFGTTAIQLASGAINNTLHNNNFSGTTAAEVAISDLGANTTTNYLVYNNSFGEIRWDNESNGSILRDMDLFGNITFPGSIIINNNSLVVNTVAFGANTFINSSVKLQFFNVGTFVVPTALENGVPCGTRCTTPTSISNGYTFNATFVGNFSIGDVSECGTITTNTTLINNLTSTGTCISFGESNIELDCAGYSINYSTAGVLGYGVNISGFHNNTVKNCVITEGNSSTSLKHGVYLTGSAQKNTIQNNTIISLGAGSRGIFLTSAGPLNSILQNNLTSPSSSAGRGITFDSTNGGSVINNTIISSPTTDGLSFQSSSDIFISNNIIITSANSYTTASISFGPGVDNLTFHNNNLTSLVTSIYDFSGNSTTSYFIYNNSFGQIEWINDTNGSFLKNMDVTGNNITFGGNIQIQNNSILVDTTGFTTSAFNSNLINSSVKLEFFNVGTFVVPTALENGVPCGDRCTIPTSITNGYTFNATFVGNFSMGGDEIIPFVTIINPINNSNLSTNFQEFNATIVESNLDNVLFMFTTNTTPFNVSPTNISNNWSTNVNVTNIVEGVHTMTVFANDTSGNINQSETVTFTVDITAPVVTIVNTSFNTTNTTPSVTFNMTDNLFSTVNCSLYLNGTFNVSNEATVNNTNTVLTVPSALPLADYNATVTCIDGSSNSGASNNVTISVITSDSSPTTTLSTPAANYINTSVTLINITFECNATDDILLQNISLYLTNSSNQSFNVNQTSSITGLTNSSNWKIELGRGNYTWNCLAYDNASQSDWGVNRTIGLSLVLDNSPNVTLSTPNSTFYYNTGTSTNVSFECNVTDDWKLQNVSLYLTNSSDELFTLNQTTLINGTTNSSNWTVELGVGNYTWNCLAYDNASQSDWDLNRTLWVSYDIFTVNLSTNATSPFQLTGRDSHNLTLNSSTNTSAEATFQSDPIALSLTVGSTQNIAAESTTVNDFSVTLDSASTSSAVLTVRSINIPITISSTPSSGGGGGSGSSAGGGSALVTINDSTVPDLTPDGPDANKSQSESIGIPEFVEDILEGPLPLAGAAFGKAVWGGTKRMFTSLSTVALLSLLGILFVFDRKLQRNLPATNIIELVEFMQKERNKGTSQNEVHARLLGVGWTKTEIQEAFKIFKRW